MASFPTSVTQQPPQPGGGGPSSGGPSPSGGPPPSGGASPVIKLAMLGQAIQGLAKEFPNGQQGIQMMLKGLQMIQSSAAAASGPQQPPAPPR